MNAITTTEARELAAPLPVGAQPLAVAANSHTGIMLSLMDRGASLEQIEKMMDLVERNEKREAEKAYNEALAAFKSLNIKIIKRKQVAFETKGGTTTYKHAELDDVVQAVGPGLSQHGFAWSWKTKQEAGHITVACVLRHKLGHSELVSLSADADMSGGKNGIQAIISTTTYLQRHTLKQICGVAEAGEDDDGNSASDEPTEFTKGWISYALSLKGDPSAFKNALREARAEFNKERDTKGLRAFNAAVGIA